MKPALVTGSTGLLGSHLCEVLHREGCPVRALVRDEAGARLVTELGAVPVRRDVTDPASLTEAAAGCAQIFHAAGAIGADTDVEAFRAVNVRGTAHVVEAARVAGARLVHVSSTAVFGQQRWDLAPVDEDTPVPELPVHDGYGRSKQEAEAVVLEACARGRVWAAVVRPPVMYGRRDRQFAPRVGPVLERGLFPLFGGGQTTLSLVHARSVAEGAVLAGGADRPAGRVYHLTEDVPITVEELVRWAGEGLGRRIWAPRLPRALGAAALGALAVGLRLTGRGEVARYAGATLDVLTRGNPFACRRAREELGWMPTTRPAVGVPDAFRWWLENRRREDGA